MTVQTVQLEPTSAPNTAEHADPWRPLVERIAKGEQAALDELRTACLSRIYTVAKRILGAAEDAEEIVYDVLLWVWRNPDRHEPARGSVGAWLHKLTWSRSIDLLRKRKRRESPLHPDPELESYEGQVKKPDGWLAQFDDRSRVHQALKTITPAQQEMILLAFFEGMSHQEIAEHLERPLGTVKSLIRRGLLQLRSVLEESETYA